MKDKLGKKSMVNNRDSSLKTDVGEPSFPVESVSISDSKQAIAANETIENFILSSKKNIEDQEQFDECFCLYEKAIISIDLFEKEVTNFERGLILSTKNEFLLRLNENYSAFIKKYNRWTSIEISKLNSTLRKSQIIQFTVSSIALTIFAFLLGNIKAMESPALKDILVINLTLLTVALSLFAFIGTFLGFLDFSMHKRNRALKVLLLLLPICCLIGLIFISIYM